MADSKHQSAHSHSDEEVKAPNLFERAKDEIEAIMHNDKSHEHHKETHGVRKDIDENTPLDVVRAPNVFERAKEEVEALIQTIQPKKNSRPHEIRLDDAKREETKQEKPNSPSEKEVETPKFMEKAEEKIEKMLHHEKSSPCHHKETHGMSNDIDENTPIDEVKGPNVFERAKEEIEAVLQTIRPKKQHTNSVPSEKSEGGFRATIGKGLKKVCSPRCNERNER